MRVYKDPFAEAKAKKKEEKRKRDAKNEAGEKDKKQRGIADCAGWTDAGVKAALDRREAERNAPTVADGADADLGVREERRAKAQRAARGAAG